MNSSCTSQFYPLQMTPGHQTAFCIANRPILLISRNHQFKSYHDVKKR